MAVNFFFLILIGIVAVRQVAYAVYCIRKKLWGGFSILFLLAGTIFCAVMIYTRGIN